MRGVGSVWGVWRVCGMWKVFRWVCGGRGCCVWSVRVCVGCGGGMWWFMEECLDCGRLEVSVI